VEKGIKNKKGIKNTIENWHYKKNSGKRRFT
jgi:hypothetical protein